MARDLFQVLDIPVATIAEDALSAMVSGVKLLQRFCDLSTFTRQIFCWFCFNLLEIVNPFTEMVRNLTPKDFIDFALIHFALHLRRHSLTTDELQVFNGHLIERLRWIGARSIRLKTLLERLLRDILEQTDHLPTGHFRQLLICKGTQV